jgi:hypothetical protein
MTQSERRLDSFYGVKTALSDVNYSASIPDALRVQNDKLP